MSLFESLSIASQALLSNKAAINVTNRNISNVYTDGYSRETPVFADIPGTGVTVETVRRIFNKAYFTRYISENQNNKGLSSYKDILEQIESVFNDLQGSGFSQELTDFFNAMNDVAVKPDDIAARSELLAKAQALVGRIRDSYSTLSEIKNTTVAKIKDEVTQLNNLLEKLAGINKDLKIYASDPERVNQYLDERDKTLTEISNLIDTKAVIKEDGTVDLYTAKGFALVLGNEAKKISFETDGNGDPILKSSGVDITSELKNGTIGGYLKGISYLNKVLGNLNTFTTNFADEINAQHKAGFDLYGETGIDFFKAENGAPTIDASNITLNFEDPKKIAAAESKDYLNADNGNIKKLIALKDNVWTNLGDKSFSEYYNTDIIVAIGAELESTKDLLTNSDFVLQAISDKMKELSSVNMDEELLNLTRYQRAYEAAAKVVNVTDELLQTILGMVR
ncbi:flagellar hook-associated protein FlgK [Desulfurobacterium thermolithotrophum DSM 11699]|uniref:Flagellar hook-associated protein 1 n=1 Tax=Desulfurobacterium thermolithotrophum (strain DSM 11699 / BSA) TaxID=868864 RepID=F0S495_DESTD|nr:flagellar hook-associated protein FlgK [Desulfurobacterium thermolithotrophum]ADY73667.1 flagellar hook-associated protein FlgK [Desulfurobacterium thermolithotrophum DSM 11699]